MQLARLVVDSILIATADCHLSSSQHALGLLVRSVLVHNRTSEFMHCPPVYHSEAYRWTLLEDEA
jgi:hypothetical protein